jgi:hypothetical protein
VIEYYVETGETHLLCLFDAKPGSDGGGARC